MRKLIISLILASTAAMPALAQDHSGGRRDRDNHSAQSDDGKRAQARAERKASAERQPAAREERAERAQVQHGDGPAAVATVQAPSRPHLVRRSGSGVEQTQVRRIRRGDDSLAGELMQVRRAQRDGTVEVHRNRPARDQAQTNRRRDGDRQWSNQWRSDRRYDWRRHRDYNRSLFRFGRYYDPYGYGYRRFSIGFNLWPSYFGSSYWLNDPWQYRLPPAYGPYRWVRYYDDALLVDIYSGQVVDVIHNFFW